MIKKMITVIPDKRVYMVSYAISKTKHFFSKKIIEFLGLENSKAMMKRMYKLFATYYFDSMMIYPTGGLYPSRFEFSYSDIRYICLTYQLEKSIAKIEVTEFSDMIYEYFVKCMSRNLKVPRVTIDKGVVSMDDNSHIKFFKTNINQINRLMKIYKYYIFSHDVVNLLLIYSSISSINNHLSIPPRLLGMFKIDVELFGSPLNTTLDKFCSPFWDIEKNFGSQGSFFEFKLSSGCNYTFNPPYVDMLMFEASKRLEDQLKTIKDYFVMGVLPAWETKFRGLEVLQRIPTFKGYEKLDDKQYPYYDYYSGTYVPASETFLIIITDREQAPTLEDIKREWLLSMV